MDAAHYLAELKNLLWGGLYVSYEQERSLPTDSHGNEWRPIPLEDGHAFEHESNEKLVRIAKKGDFLTVLVADKVDER